MRLTPNALFIAMLLAAFSLQAASQQCPTENGPGIATSITGTLEYHPSAYAWYGVRPAQPLCGQQIIQVAFDDTAGFRNAHRFVGCQVTATGNLFLPDTGSWSTSPGLIDAHLQPSTTCKLGQPLPNYAAMPIPASLKQYKITATYNPKTFDFSAQVQDTAGKPLNPWQQYVTDHGNGARDLQRMFCANGFAASDPKNALNQPDLQSNTDPDFPGAIQVTIPSSAIVQLSFTCTRSASAKDQ